MNQTICPWDFLSPQNNVFCETELCGWVVQPSNTWSNIMYLIVALLIWRSKSKASETERIFFFIATFSLFLFSGFFHLTGSYLGKMLDVSAMFIFSMGILSLALGRTLNWSTRKTLVFYSLGLIASIIYLFVMKVGGPLFGLQILLAGGLEFRLIKLKRGGLDVRLLLAACFTQLFSFGFWILDTTKALCWPDNHILSGHAIWHILSGTAIYLLFLSTIKKKRPVNKPAL